MSQDQFYLGEGMSPIVPNSFQMVTKKSFTQKVTAGNVAIPFAILLVGIILALVTLVLEIFADKICGKVRSSR